MKTDIEIAQEATMLHIREVAAKAGISEDDLEYYGKYKAIYKVPYGNSTIGEDSGVNDHGRNKTTADKSVS